MHWLFIAFGWICHHGLHTISHTSDGYHVGDGASPTYHLLFLQDSCSPMQKMDSHPPCCSGTCCFHKTLAFEGIEAQQILCQLLESLPSVAEAHKNQTRQVENSKGNLFPSSNQNCLTGDKENLSLIKNALHSKKHSVDHRFKLPRGIQLLHSSGSGDPQNLRTMVQNEQPLTYMSLSNLWSFIR